MGIYTILNNNELDGRIDKDLALCKEFILKAFGDEVLSIVLIGGYGRGEGGVVMRDNVPFPRNNYDFLIVFKKLGVRQRRTVKESMDRIKSELDTRLMTLFEYSFRTRRELERAHNIMIYQDIYNASKIIYGTEMRQILASDAILPLGIGEAMRIIRNRAMLLLLAKAGTGRRGYDATSEQIKTWYSKAIIGFGDAVLILNKKYKTRYVDKMITLERLSFPEVFEGDDSYNYFKVLHKAASLYKLKNEDCLLFSNEDKMSYVLSQVNLWVLREYLETYELSWKDIAKMSICIDRSFLKLARNICVNMMEYGPGYFFTRLFHRPAAIFTHPSEKLFTVLPLVLYKPGFDFLAACASELNMAGQASHVDVQNECVRIFEKYVA